MAIIQSYRGNAKKINLRVRRTRPIDEEELKKKKRAKKQPPSRKVKLAGNKKPKNITVRVRRYEAKQ